jgi:hypothetical protein
MLVINQLKTLFTISETPGTLMEGLCSFYSVNIILSMGSQSDLRPNRIGEFQKFKRAEFIQKYTILLNIQEKPVGSFSPAFSLSILTLLTPQNTKQKYPLT